MYISAKSDYALRALVTLAVAGRPMTAEALATAQELSVSYLETILIQLRRSGILLSQRGPDAGYRFRIPPRELTAAHVMRAVDGPLAEVRGLRPEDTTYAEPATILQDLWVATRASLRKVLEAVTIEHLATGRLPRHVKALLDDPGAWKAR